ncbi:MAG: hypothetical protein QXD70_02950 [Candidatus Bathyarchaeia archaeon]
MAVLEYFAKRCDIVLKKTHAILVLLLVVATFLIYRAYNVPFGVFDEDAFSKTIKQLIYLYNGISTFFIVGYLIRSEKDILLTVRLLLIGGWLALIYSVGELALYFGWAPWFGQIDRIVRSNPSFELSTTEVLFGFVPRLHSFAPEQSLAGFLLILPLSLAFSSSLIRYTSTRRCDRFLAVGLQFFFLFTFSRFSSLVLILSLIAIFTISFRLRPRIWVRQALILLFIICLHTSGIWLSSAERARLFPSPWGTDLSIYTRTVQQTIALQVWGETLWGTGWGLFGYYFPDRVVPYLTADTFELWSMAFQNTQSWVPINNTYLRFLTELGIEGAVLFLLLLILILYKSFKALRLSWKQHNLFILVGTSSALLAVIAGGMLAELQTFGLFWFLLAFAELVSDYFCLNPPRTIPKTNQGRNANAYCN